MLEGHDLHASYGATPALRGVSLSASAGESVAIVGPSGCGKSTLLQSLAGLHEPDQGSVTFEGDNLYALSDKDRSSVRLSRFGFVFQTSELIAEFTLRENIALPVELNGASRRQSLTTASALIERLGLEECADRRPFNVSGGQRQRAAIARAMATNPAVIFADEPTGALDSDNRDVVLELLLSTARESSALLVLVTHDADVASRLDRSVAMHDGTISSTVRQ